MQYLWRILIAAIVCVLIYALIPPFFSVIGFSMSAALFRVVQIVTAGLAIFYVIFGPPVVKG